MNVFYVALIHSFEMDLFEYLGSPCLCNVCVYVRFEHHCCWHANILVFNQECEAYIDSYIWEILHHKFYSVNSVSV